MTEIKAGQWGWTGLHAEGAGGCCAWSETGALVLFRATPRQFWDNTMQLLWPQNVLLEPDGPRCHQEGRCWEQASLAKASAVGLSAISLLRQPLDIKVSLPPYMSTRPRD